MKRVIRVINAPWLIAMVLLSAAGVVGVLGAVSLLPSSVLASAEPPSDGKTSYTMSADTWTMEPPIPSMGGEAGSAKFERYESMPTGTMTLNEGVAASKIARFSTGSIDFDIKPIGYDDAGVVFHRQGSEDGEFVYLRANPDCPAANDCIQYAPITHTMMGWNIYSNYQGPAPISVTGWNHVHIEVIRDGMRVYVNHAAEPSLVVPRLWGLRHDGGIAFKGPAIYANLVVDPHASAGRRAPTTAAALSRRRTRRSGMSGARSRWSRLVWLTWAARSAWRGLLHPPWAGSRPRLRPRRLCAGRWRSASRKRYGCS